MKNKVGTTKQQLIGEKFGTQENYNGKLLGIHGWKVVGVLPNDMLELKQIRAGKNISIRPLFGNKIGFGGNGKLAGKWHMPVPRFYGEICW